MKPILMGLLGTSLLLGFYFLTMRLLTGGFEAAVDQFENLWYFMVPLAIGFGIQVGLYVHLRTKMKSLQSKKLLAGNTTTSAVAMIACCAHHATDVLPFIGLAFVSTILVKYQTVILIIAIGSNIVGIYILLELISKSAFVTKVSKFERKR